MNNDLPNIFKGKVEKSNNQNESVLNEDSNIKEEIVENIEKKSVNRQIKDIFNSEDFVYKAKVLITLNDGSNIEKTIIGRSNNSLITIDDELIDVKNISKIEII